MGLYTLKPRATEIQKVKVTHMFSQPILRHSVSAREPAVSASDAKLFTPLIGSHTDSQLRQSGPGIADRRQQKFESKSRLVGLHYPHKLQLPSIKDTSDGDPSVLSEARPLSDIVSTDFEQQALHGVADVNADPAKLAQTKNILSVSKEAPVRGLNRQQTCQVQSTNYFGSGFGSATSSKISQNSSSKNQVKESSLHGRWTDEEHQKFLQGLYLFKKDWRSIERHIGTRTCSQIRSHAQKYFLRLEKQQSGGHAEFNPNTTTQLS